MCVRERVRERERESRIYMCVHVKNTCTCSEDVGEFFSQGMHIYKKHGTRATSAHGRRKKDTTEALCALWPTWCRYTTVKVTHAHTPACPLARMPTPTRSTAPQLLPRLCLVLSGHDMPLANPQGTPSPQPSHKPLPASTSPASTSSPPLSSESHSKTRTSCIHHGAHLAGGTSWLPS